jgi:hypothetical protein
MNVGLTNARLRTFKVLRRCSRVAFCFVLMNRFESTAHAASRRAGYGSVDAFERDVKRLCSLSPGAMIKTLTEDDLIRKIVEHCFLDVQSARKDSGASEQPVPA